MTALRISLPLLATLAACKGEPPDDEYRTCVEADPVDPAGLESTWVVDGVQIATTASQANSLGLNLDCDAENRPDNALGQVLSIIYGGGIESSDVNAEIAAMIADGRLLHLVSLQATSTTNASGVGFTLMHGLDVDGDPSDNFSGGESFAIDTGRGHGRVSGYLMDGRLALEGDQLPLGLLLPTLDEVVIVPIERARVDATLADGSIAGRIAGAVPQEAVDAILIPFIHRAIQRAIERDCTGYANGDRCGCAQGTFGDTLIGVFDELPAGGDCAIGLDEFRDNDLLAALLSPDVDLFDEDGVLAPRADGVKDSLSIGVGFTAVPAELQ